MKIGILQTGHAPDPMIGPFGDYDQLFEKLLSGNDFDFEVYPVVDGVFPEGPEAAEGWIVTGSRHGAYEDHPWIPPLEQLIRAIKDRGLPMIGVCFGHQIIAQALGGKVEKFSGGWSIGRTEYMLDGEPVVLNAWHQDQVTELPEGARVLGGNEFCENAVLAYGDSIWTVQPHPEFSPDFVGELIESRGRGNVPDDLLDSASAQLDAPVDSTRIARLMADFLKRKRSL